MLGPLLLAVLTLAQDPASGPKPPSPERVKAAVTQLEEAFKKGAGPERIQAIEESTEVLHADVVAWIAKGLKDKDQEVLRAALSSLGTMQYPDAYNALHDFVRKDKKLRQDDELGSQMWKALGRHGNPQSVELLAADALGVAAHSADRARILSLGRVRDQAALEALISLMNGLGVRLVDGWMDDIRLSFSVLTGVKEPGSREQIQRWWNENKKTFKVAAEMPELGKLAKLKWNAYWDIEDPEAETPEKPQKPEKPEKKSGQGDHPLEGK